MRRDRLAGTVELAMSLGMLVGFLALLLVPAVLRFAIELAWAIGSPPTLPTFGVNPHWVAGARYAPSLIILLACGSLAAWYRWLISRRRGG